MKIIKYFIEEKMTKEDIEYILNAYNKQFPSLTKSIFTQGSGGVALMHYKIILVNGTCISIHHVYD